MRPNAPSAPGHNRQTRRHQVRQNLRWRNLARPGDDSPYSFYQIWLNAEDAKAGDYLEIFTFLPQPGRNHGARGIRQERSARQEAQRAFAEDITTLVHGEKTMHPVCAATQALFGSGDLTTLDASTLLRLIVGRHVCSKTARALCPPRRSTALKPPRPETISHVLRTEAAPTRRSSPTMDGGRYQHSMRGR